MTRQYLRTAELTLEKGSDTITIGGETGSTLRFSFSVEHGDKMSPNRAAIKVYNLAQSSEAKFLKELGKVSLSAGYPGNTGLIFKGEIIQTFTGKDSPVDSFVFTLASDADTALNYGVVNKALAAGHTYRDQVMECFKAFQPHGVELGFIADLGSKRFSRGAILTGMAKDVLRRISFATQCSPSIQNGKFQMVKSTGTLPGGAIVLNSRTGMIGRPQQTIGGIVVRTLLNPRIVVGVIVQIDQKSIDRQVFDASYTGAVTNTLIPDVTVDGLYKVLFVDHQGDSRGGDWYTTATCVALNSNKGIPISQAVRGIPLEPPINGQY